MLPSRAVKAFIDRKRDDWRPWREYSLDKLEDLQERLEVRPPIWNRLDKPQKVCLLLGAKLRRFCFFNDTGTGKTLLAIALIRYFARMGEAKRVLVLVPNKSNKWEWVDEIEKHSPKTSYEVLVGTSRNKWEQLRQTDTRIVIETYAGLFRMACEVVEVEKNGRKRNKLAPSNKLVKELVATFNGLIMDESIHVKTKNTLPFRICRQLVKKAAFAFAMNGTPFSKDPLDMWAQMWLVDGGASIGETMGLFREAFYTKTKNHWGGFEYTFNKRKEALLNRFIAHRSIRYVADEADLPKVKAITKYVTLPYEADEYYDKAKQAVIEAKGSYRDTMNSFLRMRQISSGFLGYFDDELAIRAEIEFKPNPKLEMMLGTIQTIDPSYKILIFHDFVFSGSMIERELIKLKIGYVRLSRKTKDDELTAMRRKFESDPDCRCFILSTAGAFGLNLQVAKYGMFYESPLRLIHRKQMIRRFERQKSLHKTVFLYDFIVRDTVDEQIMEGHRKGKEIFEAIVEGKLKPW